jgi:hypothetical protein
MAFLPPRILNVAISDVQPTDTWTVDDGTGDPWVGYPYRFQLTMDVSGQPHSSHLTREPYYYSGFDVQVGDWIADVATGQALKIIEIVEQANEYLILVGEDVDRFNTFTDPTQQGSGGIATGSGFIFQLGDDGLPILSPMTVTESALRNNLAWQLDMISRFRFRNYLRSHYPVHQSEHGFAVGDLLVLGSEGYEHAAADDYVESIVGTVSAVGIPGADWFNYRPVGRVVEGLEPSLPGEPGDLIYISATGSLTLTKPTAWAKPVYIRLETGTKGIVLDRTVEAVGKNGYSSQTYVVTSIAARDALEDLNVGDQALVKNMGNGEWSHYIFEAGGEWTLLVTEDASNVDSASKQITVTYQSDPSSIICAISTGRRIDKVVIQVKEAFDGVASITVGTDANKTWFMPSEQNDLSIVGDYQSEPACILNNGGADTLAKYWLTTAGCTKGRAIVSITYS